MTAISYHWLFTSWVLEWTPEVWARTVNMSFLTLEQGYIKLSISPLTGLFHLLKSAVYFLNHPLSGKYNKLINACSFIYRSKNSYLWSNMPCITGGRWLSAAEFDVVMPFFFFLLHLQREFRVKLFLLRVLFFFF